MPAVAALAVGDPPELWADLGFAVDGGSCRVGGITVGLGAAPPGTGIASWELTGIEGSGPSDLDGLATTFAAGSGGSEASPPPLHPNGAVAVDHIVVVTPAFERTVGRLEDAGLLLRRRRTPDDARPMNMAFFRVGETILEVVESRQLPEGPARFWGLAVTVSDLEAAAALLGPRLRPVRPALQPGRSIAAVDRSCGSAVELAFMSPAPRREP